MPSLDRDLAPLMAAALAGDDRAYRRLLEGLAVYLRGHVRHLLARSGRPDPADVEDVVQDILVAVHSRRHTYDPGYPFSVWIHAVARHKAIDHLRRRIRRGDSLPIDDFSETLPSRPEPSGDVAFDIERVLAAVPARLRGAFTAVKIEGHTIGDAAATVGMSETALKVALHRVMRRLSAAFGRDHDDRRR